MKPGFYWYKAQHDNPTHEGQWTIIQVDDTGEVYILGSDMMLTVGDLEGEVEKIERGGYGTQRTNNL